MYEAKCVLENNAVLGEGPVWCPREGVLYWIDIGHFTLPGYADSGAPWETTISPSLHRFDPKSGTDEVFKVPQSIGSFALREGGGFVGAFREGLATFDLPDATLGYIEPVERELTGNRFNDGKCDRAGRFWAGSMDLSCREPTGSLYRLDADRTVTAMDAGIVVANGLGWSPDNSLMYYIDSATQRIDVYDFDFDTGRLANKRTFVDVPPQDGCPDGMTVDSEGFVWCALSGGWRVTRFDPSGAVDAVVKFPVTGVTSCVLGGEDLKTLYVTSSRWDLTLQDVAEQPLSGSLFAIEVDVPGLVEPRYAG